MNSCWWYQKRWMPIRVGGPMCNSSTQPSLTSAPSPLWCAVAYTVGLSLPLPQTSHRVFPSQIWQCNRPDVWTVRRTNQRYSFLGKEGRSSVLRAVMEDPCFIWKEKRWVLAYIPFSCEDLTERFCWSSLLLWFTWRCCVHVPFPGN